MSTYYESVTLTRMECGCCGGVYAISEAYRAEQYKKAGHWNCPYCRTQWGYGQTEAEWLKTQLADATRRAENARANAEQYRIDRDHQARRAAAARGQLTKIKRRVGNGICPCCSRTFADLARHMSAQHPDFQQEREP